MDSVIASFIHYRRPASAEIVEWGDVRGSAVALPTHFHDEDQVTLVLSGRRRFWVGGTLVVLGPSDGVGFPAGTPHGSLDEPEGVVCCNAYLPTGAYALPDLVAAMSSIWRLGGGLDEPALLAVLCEHRVELAAAPRRPWRPGTVAEAARRAGLSREGFSRAFRRSHGLAPQTFGMMARLNAARALLRAGETLAAGGGRDRLRGPEPPRPGLSPRLRRHARALPGARHIRSRPGVLPPIRLWLRMEPAVTPIQAFALSLAVIGAGVSLALQQVLNTNLRADLGSPWWAGVTSYAVGLMTMLVLALAMPGPRLTAALAARAAWPSWSGGVFGSIFVITAILAVPRLGAASVLALVVVGQMLGAIAFDHIGLLGLPQHAASPIRLIGAVLLILGVVLVRR